jgi:hypothetical protein
MLIRLSFAVVVFASAMLALRRADAVGRWERVGIAGACGLAAGLLW